LPAPRVAVHDRQVRHWRGRAIYSLLVCVVLLAGLVLHSGAMPLWTALGSPLGPQSIPLKFNDQGLRQLAIEAPCPAYPSASLDNNVTGVVVATVRIDLNGQLRSVKIVESPDAATGRAVRDALMRWVFRPLVVPRANVVTGDMIFYFHRAGDRGVVSSPEELQKIKAVTTPTEKPPQAPPVVRVIDEAELGRLRGTIAPVVLDVRSRAAHLRSHRDGAVNIPVRELQTRSGAELPRSRLIVIDCFAEQQYLGLCGMAVHVLTSHGFSEVAVLNRRAD
jgi:TonB family protein